MKEDFSNNDLEKRLRKEADQFTLSPSEEVWSRIDEQLHPRKNRRAWLWAAAALLGLFLTSYVIWLSRRPSVSLDEPAAAISGPPAATERNGGRSAADLSRPGTDGNTLSKTRDVSRPEGAGIETVSRGGNAAAAIVAEKTGSENDGRVLPVPEAPSGNDRQDRGGASSAGKLPFLLGTKALTLREVPPPAFSFEITSPAPMQGLAMQTKPPLTGPLEDPLELQMSGKKPEKKRKPSFEVYFAPGRSYRLLDMPGGAADSRQMDNLLSGFAVVTNNKIDHKADWGFSAGILGIFPFADRWSLETGLTVTQLGYSVKAFGSYPASIGSNGNYNMASPSSAGRANSFYVTSTFASQAARKPAYIHNSYLYGQVPLLVSYRFGAENKFHINVAAGGGLLYLFRSSPVTFAPGSGRYFVDKNLLRPFNASLEGGVEAVFPISRHIRLVLGPGIQYQLFSTYKNYPQVKEHPYLPGIKVGLRWLQ